MHIKMSIQEKKCKKEKQFPCMARQNTIYTICLQILVLEWIKYLIYNTNRLFYVDSCMDNSAFYINILQRIPLYKHV